MELKMKPTIGEYDIYQWLRGQGIDTGKMPSLTGVMEDGYTATMSKYSLEDWVECLLDDYNNGEITIDRYEEQAIPLNMLSEHIQKLLKDMGLTGEEQIVIMT